VIGNNRVITDQDLADLFLIDINQLRKKVKANLNRFPCDFMLILSKDDGHITKGSYVFTITDKSETTKTTTTKDKEANTFLQRTVIDNVNLEYKITPLQVGINTFIVALKDENNKPLSNINNVIMQFTNQNQNIGPIIANLKKTGDGVYRVTGVYLSQEGEWNVKITVQRSGQYDFNHSFEISITSK
jgi:hypothetical protein